MSKIKVSNGKEQYEIDAADLKSAMADGFKEVKQIPVTNGKEVLYIDDTDLENAMKDGYVKKKDGSDSLPTTVDKGLSNIPTGEVESKVVEENPQETILDLILKSHDLSNKEKATPVVQGYGAASSYGMGGVPDKEAQAEGAKLKTSLAEQGIDADKFNKLLVGEDIPQEIRVDINNKIEQNPNRAFRYLSSQAVFNPLSKNVEQQLSDAVGINDENKAEGIKQDIQIINQ